MTKYVIELHIKGGGIVEIQCKDKKEFQSKGKMFQRVLPNQQWQTKRRIGSS